ATLVREGVGRESQTLTFGGPFTAPTAPQAFSLSLGPVTSPVQNLTFLTGRSSLQSAFDAMLGTGNVLVLGPNQAVPGSVYSVVFGGVLGVTNLPQLLPLVAGGATLTAATLGDGIADNELQALTITGSGNEVQTITLSSGANDLSGTFRITYTSLGGTPQTTAPIPFNASASQVQSALEALSLIGPGNVAVVGSSGAGGGTYTLTFQRALGNTNVNQVTVNGS